MDIAKIRKVAREHTAEALDIAIEYYIEDGSNPDFLDLLSKARFVRDMMDKGMSEQEAVRELGRRVRMIAA